MATKKAMINSSINGGYDEMYTPEYAITPLLKHLNKFKGKTVWECTDYGSSNITKVLKENGFIVKSTHITNSNFDFLNDKPDFEFDLIITNPPYSTKTKFIEKCYEYEKPFAMLMPLTTLEGEDRGEMFGKNGIEVMVFDTRVDYMDKGSTAWYNTSWFCHDILPKTLVFQKLNKPKKERKKKDDTTIQ